MKYPKDRFDDIPPSIDRRGAHRAPRTRAAKIAAWLWGLAAVVVLVGLALLGMFLIDRVVSSGGGSTEPTATETEAAPAEPAPAEPAPVEPARDPEIPVTVLNGTDQSGVAGSTGDTLSGQGWNVAGTGDADSEDHDATIVYYGDPANEAAALAVVQDLGGGTATLDPAQAPVGTITVVVGTDLA